jgi:hypothetical protein
VSARCPFYGFRWPDHTSDLIQVGGHECGLDLQCNGRCKMEREGRTVNFDYCEVPLHYKPLIEAFRDRIRFRLKGVPEPLTFAAWRRASMSRKAS